MPIADACAEEAVRVEERGSRLQSVLIVTRGVARGIVWGMGEGGGGGGKTKNVGSDGSGTEGAHEVAANEQVGLGRRGKHHDSAPAQHPGEAAVTRTHWSSETIPHNLNRLVISRENTLSIVQRHPKMANIWAMGMRVDGGREG